ncbi:DNA polymerase III subunit delta' [Bacterioplanes sanyensis]|uniref:DNA polymerase III subunit delta' n=1 Tax=Bacterioplanes sanyensis TaxID=1249553 RepID=A0A222FNT3_9GAMM|nr:DNA polymerase III subunit delta' [Bacterioplanes sanyensis]ASP39873.1 DNA polymerase III subunit delta' [Bacterioplanes sanyensis]
MSFSWQEQAWQGLVERHHHAGLPHAMMFTGLAGIGKHQLIERLAQWLLCLTPDEQGACQRCHSCLLWQAGNHPDYLHCGPQDNSHQIRIDAIRQVNQFLSQTPQISRCQLVSLEPAEVMNVSAANALLKTLEEPPGESYLLLSAERYGSVMPTIRSRCQRIALAAPTAEQAQQWLCQQGLSETVAEQALRFNPGAPLAALQWVNDGLHDQLQQWQQQLLQWTHGSISLAEVAEPWSKRLDFELVCRWWLQLLVDALKVQLGARAEQLVFDGLVEQIAALSAPSLDRGRLLGMHNKVQTMVGRLASGAAHYNKQLTVETLLLDWRELVMTGQRRETA